MQIWFCWLKQLDYPVCSKDIDLPPQFSRELLQRFLDNEVGKYDYLPVAETVVDNFASLNYLTEKAVNPWK